MPTRIALFFVALCCAVACSEPTVEPVLEAGPGQFVAVSTGRTHACAIDTIGRAWCWGANERGQVGAPVEECAGCPRLPAPVATDHRFVAISAGGTHTCGLATDGLAYCWGDNGLGQLGVTDVGNCAPDTSCSDTAVAVGDGYRFKSLAAGSLGTCGITTDDVLKCWGVQGLNGSFVLRSPTTVLLQATGDSLWSSVGRTDDMNGCGLTADGVAACWGSNFYGQGGFGGVTSGLSNPLAIALDVPVRSVSSGDDFSCALSSAGDAYCWGLSRSGSLALGGSAPAASCSLPSPFACYAAPLKVIGGHKYSQLAVGQRHACGLEATSSRVYCWGQNIDAAIGSQELGLASVAPSPFPAANETMYTSIDAGLLFTCGVMLDRNVSCWGRNFEGQLGRPTTLYFTAVPILIATDGQ